MVNEVRLVDCALIIATYNRPERIEELLKTFLMQKELPKLIVVVDSSDDSNLCNKYQEISMQLATQLVLIRSSPGAPYQRNLGIEYVVNEYRFSTDVKVICFLDDDIVVPDGYFKKVSYLFDKYSDFVCIGGFDVLVKPPHKSLLSRIMMIGGVGKEGKLLKSGIAVACIPNIEICETDWTPGGMQSIAAHALESTRFDDSVRIYGDETELQIRLRALGKIGVSNLLCVEHLGATKAKDTLRVSEGYMDGFRWSLAKKYPQRVNKKAVLYTTLCLTFAELLFWVFGKKTTAKQKFLGHADFLSRIIWGKPVVQLNSEKTREVETTEF